MVCTRVVVVLRSERFLKIWMSCFSLSEGSSSPRTIKWSAPCLLFRIMLRGCTVVVHRFSPHARRTITPATLHLRLFNTSSNVNGEVKEGECPEATKAPKFEPLYKGVISRQLKTLKTISIFGCLGTVVGLPTLFLCGYGKEAIALQGQLAITGTVMTVGVLSTIVLHSIVRPYVRELEVDYSNKSDPTIAVETLNIFARPKRTEFLLSDVEPTPDNVRPHVSFRANGNNFYVQGGGFKDKELFKKLVGRGLFDDEMT